VRTKADHYTATFGITDVDYVIVEILVIGRCLQCGKCIHHLWKWVILMVCYTHVLWKVTQCYQLLMGFDF